MALAGYRVCSDADCGGCRDGDETPSSEREARSVLATPVDSTPVDS